MNELDECIEIRHGSILMVTVPEQVWVPWSMLIIVVMDSCAASIPKHATTRRTFFSWGSTER